MEIPVDVSAHNQSADLKVEPPPTDGGDILIVIKIGKSPSQPLRDQY